MKKNKKAFTLVELLVVIAILAILATVSILGYTSFTDKAKKSVAEDELLQIKTVLLADWLDGFVGEPEDRIAITKGADDYTITGIQKHLDGTEVTDDKGQSDEDCKYWVARAVNETLSGQANVSMSGNYISASEQYALNNLVFEIKNGKLTAVKYTCSNNYQATWTIKGDKITSANLSK